MNAEKIKKLRMKKITIANDFQRLKNQIREKKSLIQFETNSVMKKRLEDEVADLGAGIVEKRKEMDQLDDELKAYDAV